MPRLFSSFGRLKTSVSPSQDQYYNYSMHHQEPYYGNPQQSAGRGGGGGWRRKLGKKPREEQWGEEMVDYPSFSAPNAGPPHAYPDGGNPQMSVYPRGRGQPAMQAYRENSLLNQEDYTDDTYDAQFEQHENYDPPPIVQRESSDHNSFTRLQDAFADRSHAVTEIPLPESRRNTAADLQTPTEYRDVFASASHPVLVNNSVVESVRPDIGHAYPGHPHRGYHPSSHAQYRHRSRGGHKEDHRREHNKNHYAPSSSSGSYAHSDEEEYPSCVVVVDRGRHGKQDTYYVIPGGAPVIFQDEYGHELTRVGDFSGRYKPRPLSRPVIIQDENGREIYRMGFPEDTNTYNGYYPSSRHRGFDDRYESERKSPYRRHGHDGGYSSSDYYDRYAGKPTPKVVYVDPSSNSSYGVKMPRSGSASMYSRNSGPSRGAHIMYLDQLKRQRSGSDSSHSLEGRSYHGSSAHSHHSSHRQSPGYIRR
ncbi:hypothetical protein K474DRAFT_554198 [Panus rudis PR-1116 ss-1]|nr:hypothetical protein K474DRAFT_554198 [Panus rudis PR-1116 ss-1]